MRKTPRSFWAEIAIQYLPSNLSTVLYIDMARNGDMIYVAN